MEITIKMRANNEDELIDIIRGIGKMQKEQKGNCVFSVYIPFDETCVVDPPLKESFNDITV